MPSNVDPAVPVAGTPTTQSVRDNFAVAKTEIEALQAAVNNILAAFGKRAELTDDRANGTSVASGPANTWNTRTLNTVISNGGGIVSLAANQFTLVPGRYRIHGAFTFGPVSSLRLRLQNITGATTEKESINTVFNANTFNLYTVEIDHILTISAANTYEFQERHDIGNGTYGNGEYMPIDAYERYARVTIDALPN